jgi:hypothetical protein
MDDRENVMQALQPWFRILYTVASRAVQRACEEMTARGYSKSWRAWTIRDQFLRSIEELSITSPEVEIRQIQSVKLMAIDRYLFRFRKFNSKLQTRFNPTQLSFDWENQQFELFPDLGHLNLNIGYVLDGFQLSAKSIVITCPRGYTGYRWKIDIGRFLESAVQSVPETLQTSTPRKSKAKPKQSYGTQSEIRDDAI